MYGHFVDELQQFGKLTTFLTKPMNKSFFCPLIKGCDAMSLLSEITHHVSSYEYKGYTIK